MNNILGLLLLVLFGGAGLISVFAIISLLLPATVERTRATLENSLGRSLLLGLINFLFAVALSALLALPAQSGGIIGGIFIFLIGLVALAVIAKTLLGLVAATSLLGSRIGATNSPTTIYIRSGILLVFACLTPYFGWFVFTPLVIWTAFGAALRAFLPKRKVSLPAEE